MNEVNIISLQQLYLMALVETLKADKLDAVLQDLSQETRSSDTGRLWLVRNGTTVPEASIAFQFERDSVNLAVVTRNERELKRVIKYAEGLDGYLEDLQKFLRSGLLSAPKAKRAA